MITATIHEFNPQIYPCRLWVSIRPSYENVSAKFHGLSTDCQRVDITKNYFEPNHFVIARTALVASKDTDGFIGCMVMIFHQKQMDVKTIAHESCHVADFICEQFGIQSRAFDEGEPYAYLVGWVAKCIHSVVTGKF